jgi:hypothetical protein
MPDIDLHDTHWGNNSDATLESLIRAAGDYVHPTGDLRPRTLETARLRCRQQRRASGIAVAALFLAVLIPSGNRQPHLAPFGRLSVSAASQSPGQVSDALGRETGDWALVEIFTQLRRQQAELLHGVSATR